MPIQIKEEIIMRINNNVTAINTHRQYTMNTESVAKSTEKLSSGFRVNRAGDDAAGLAISEKMRAQIRGLNMATKNSQDAISLIQTAEGALQETHNILQRMRELAVQSASDTNQDDVDRTSLNMEFEALIDEINDTARTTKFNNMGLIDGTFGASASVNASSTLKEGLNGITKISLSGFTDSGALTVVENTGDATKLDFTFGSETQTVDLPTDGSSGSLSVAFSDGKSVTISFNEVAADELDGTQIDIDVSGTGAFIQTGANTGDNLSFSIGKMDADAIGLAFDASSPLGSEQFGIETREKASEAINIVNNAINNVSTQRSALGALQNRMTHKIANLKTSTENLQAAESRIRDLDMAAEMTTYTRNNILVQASTAMLAQANAAPQGVLQLLQ